MRYPGDERRNSSRAVVEEVMKGLLANDPRFGIQVAEVPYRTIPLSSDGSLPPNMIVRTAIISPSIRW